MSRTVKAVLAVTSAVAVGLIASLVVQRRDRSATASDPVPSAVADQADQARRPRGFASVPPPPPALQNVPTAKNYDAAKLARAGEVPPEKIFAGEPRDPLWAPKMESTTGEIIGKDLTSTAIPARVRGIECRTAVCRVILESDTKEGLKKAAELMFLTSMTENVNVTGSAGPPGESATFHLIFGRDHRELEDYTRFYKERRPRLIAAARHSGVEPSLIPPE